MPISVWWIRRDIRLLDNPVLEAARSGGNFVIPVFIIDQNLLDKNIVGEKRLSFMFGGLTALNEDLKKRSSYLVVRKGKPIEELTKLSSELNKFGEVKIFTEEDFSPYARLRDQKIGKTLPLKYIDHPTLIHPNSIIKSDFSPYKIYTPFNRAWKSKLRETKIEIIPAPERISTPPNIFSHSLPFQMPSTQFPSGEREATTRLHKFINQNNAPIYQYATTRNALDVTGTSQISPYLHFGMISIRVAVKNSLIAMRNALDGHSPRSAESWLDELIWREFFYYILYHFPNTLHENFRHVKIDWENDPDSFELWRNGQTGIPIIDAAMRQLSYSGWIHNRVRMVVASFLTKNLLIDWRWGEKWFMQHLIDGDAASNSGGWQWAASTGVDAVPYFRIFNPITQSKKFDPDGNYIRNWIPELADIPTEFIHEPQRMPTNIQQRFGCIIGEDYPDPIINLVWSRERAISTFKRSK